MNYTRGTLRRKLEREIDASTCTSYQRNLQVTPHLISRLGLEAELEGHQGCVNCLEWNEKGTLLASGSDDVQIMIWDPFKKKSKAIIHTGHQGNIFSVKFLPNSGDATLVSGAADCKIRVHDLNVGETTHVFSCHINRVKRLATAPHVPFMFWSAAEDGLIMQYDLRSPETCQPNGKNVLVNLKAHMGGEAEAKCIAINPHNPEQLAVGANDPFVRLYDRRMLTCSSVKLPNDNGSRSVFERSNLMANLSPEGFKLPEGCVQYFKAGHLPRKQTDFKKRYRTLNATYVTFSPDGCELLVNLGGEQIYLFDVNRRRKPQKFDLSMVMTANGVCREPACNHSNGFSLSRNGTTATTNGVTNGVMQHSFIHTTPTTPTSPLPPVSPTISQSTSAQEADNEGKKKNSKRHKSEGRTLPAAVEALKRKANSYFEKEQYTKAIMLYNEGIVRCPATAVMYANRAAAYMKRKWDGDLYAALRDCHNALRHDHNHLKAHFRLARCLHELSWPKEAFDCLNKFKSKFPDYARSHACEALDKDIRAAIFSSASEPEDSNQSNSDSPQHRRNRLSDQEKQWQSDACDYEARFCGHCNTTTDIKEANYFGSNGQYIVAGSDDGSFFIWDKTTSNIVRVLRGDESIVNCLQPHPSYCLLATSGIDPVVRLWSPKPEDGSKNEREVDNSDDAALANQRRMNADPLEVMLMNMGYRFSTVFDVDDAEEESRPDQPVNCRPS
ncbi:hypothetical protein CHS0354_002500 [Potamilus streckersoni]|uniref:WD and tetratricopeptide repeats protein 1 n=1 Tax=Potamilus streckersoni TaxID=2493646 RepID=A0AAE0SSR0_9BIVA|nr:hypothetical protein CHS0354_002500 [Potamilus streckersoni]